MTIVGWASRALAARTSRRGFLARTAVAACALAATPRRCLFEPVSADDAICGAGNTCGSGWTVMCCTINNGVNGCPPGSFAAGWWKADGSPFCCGAPRYYIDCNASCRPQGGYDCGCHCHTDPTTCDHRRVCCNQFRYGQCHQEIACYGPVVCRVISCIPPYLLDPACTTTVATDNATATHNAPCLPSCNTPVDAHWLATGGPSGPLGYPTSAELPAPDGAGRYRAYERGVVAWTAAIGPHAVWGAIRDRWIGLGGLSGPFGYPVTDVEDVAGGQRCDFQGGSIAVDGATGAVTQAAAGGWLNG